MDLRVEIGGRVRTRRVVRSPALIGLHETADVLLDGAEGVNRRHALLVHYLSSWAIHDLASVNGVRRNGKRVRRADVTAGDELTIGRAQLTVLDDNPPTNDTNQTDDSWAASVLANEEDEGAVFGARCGIRVSRNGQEALEVVVDGDRLIGYAARADIRLPHGAVSSLQCLLAKDSSAWYLHDLHSKTGIVHKGQRVRTVSLVNGDQVRLGDMVLQIRLLSEEGEATRRTKTPSSHDATLSGGSSGSFIFPADDSDSLSDLASISIPPLAIDFGKRGHKAFRAEQYEEAVAHFARACFLAPFVGAFRKHLRASQVRAVRRQPADPPPSYWPLLWWQMRAYRALSQGRLPTALNRAERGLELDPWNKGLLLIEARAFEEKNLFDLSLWCLLSARARAPADPEINRPAAKLFHHLLSFDRALALWQLVAKTQPRNPETEKSIKKLMVDKTIHDGGYRVGKV